MSLANQHSNESAILANLNPAQKEAVMTIEGPVLTLAGPGSGKTRALTHRVAYLVQEQGVSPWRILAVTFTNKAAREMKTRLGEMLTERDVYRVSMGTFHALCARWLRRDVSALGHYDSNFVIYDTDDQQTIVKQALRDLDIDEKRWRPNSLHRVISNAKNEMVTPDKFQARTYQEEVAARVYERYQELLIESNAMDFDDLLMVTHFMFKQQPDILERYQEQYLHVMVDEFQDTNIVQYELTKMLGGQHGNIFAVGDLDQGIYSWRGADYRNVLYFQRDYPDHKLIRLAQNYRSTETIVRASQQIISRNENRIKNDLFTERGQGVQIKVAEAYDAEEEADYVLREIRNLTQGGNVDAGDIAIMYRTNAQSRVFEEAFIKQGLPYLLVRGTRFYDRKEVKDMLAFFRLIHNPADSVSLSRIINVPPRSIGAKTLETLDRWAFKQRIPLNTALLSLVDEESPDPPFSNRAKNALTNFAKMLRQFITAKQRLSLTELFDLVVARTEYKQYLNPDTDEGAERWDNLVELRRAMEQYGELLAEETLGQFLENVALVADVDALGDEATGTALLTLHTAKGLEFAVVFIVGMEEGLFPHSRSTEDAERMEEERRLAYVGVTRAKDRLYLTHAFRRQRGYGGYTETTTPSRFLGDISPDLVVDGNKPAQKSPAKSSSTGKKAQAGKKKEPQSTSPAKAKFHMGDKVLHPKFGQGTVISTQIKGGAEYVQVAFPGQGVRKLAVSIAPLKLL